MLIGNGVVLIGMGECFLCQVIGQVVQLLFVKGVVEWVIVVGLLKFCVVMYLDIVFSFCDCDLVMVFLEVVKEIVFFSLCFDLSSFYGMNICCEEKIFFEVVVEFFGLKKLCVVEIGGNSFVVECE